MSYSSYHLIDQLENIIIERFNKEEINFSIDDCLFLQYLNFVRRRITKHPRVCLESSIFQSELKELPKLRQKGFYKLKKAIETGEDLNKYQSTKIDIATYTDKLYLHESFIHFHLGLKRKNLRFMKRSSELAIVHINDEKVIFIKIMKHNQTTWTSDDYIKILDLEFPEVIKNKKLIGIKSDEYTIEEITLLREKGAMYCRGNKDKNGYINSNEPIKSIKESKIEQVKAKDLQIRENLFRELIRLSLTNEEIKLIQINDELTEITFEKKGKLQTEYFKLELLK